MAKFKNGLISFCISRFIDMESRRVKQKQSRPSFKLLNGQ